MSRINPRLQQYNNKESYTMGKEAAKFLIGQLFARQITSAEFEKQFGTVEKYLCWYEIQNDLPNSFITDGEEMCELLKMISPSGAEDYKQECLKRMAEAKKQKEEKEQNVLEDAMAAANLNDTNVSTPSEEVVPPIPTPSSEEVVPPIPTPTAVTEKPKKKNGGRKKKVA